MWLVIMTTINTSTLFTQTLYFRALCGNFFIQCSMRHVKYIENLNKDKAGNVANSQFCANTLLNKRLYGNKRSSFAILICYAPSHLLVMSVKFVFIMKQNKLNIVYVS